MPIINTENSSERIPQPIVDFAAKVFPVALIASLLLFAYLLYGLFSGQLMDAQGIKADDAAHALEVVNKLAVWINISLTVALVSGCIVYFESTTLGTSLVILAAVLGFGLQFFADFMGTKMTDGAASQAALSIFHRSALILGVPGILLVLRDMLARFQENRYGQDLTTMTYGGGNVEKEEVPGALIGMFAKCWQLPFCRESIRKRCPIFHAKTKCWKERVGCMCEENIILIAMSGNEGQTPEAAHASMGQASGFVPIGDLIAKSEEERRKNVPMRTGPRGVRIPDNPHLSMAQKKERCRNCIIYNEHQRQKYQFLSAPATLIVPLLVYLQFDTIKGLLEAFLRGLESLLGKLAFKSGSTVGADIADKVSGSLSVEVILIVCLTLVLMTWAQRFLEYCVYKIKI